MRPAEVCGYIPMVQETVVAHYKGFIEVASCLRELKSEVAAIGEHLDALQQDLPALSDACTGFSARSKEHTARRIQNKQLLSQPFVLSFSRTLLSFVFLRTD